MKVAEIRTESGFDDLRPEWNQLVERSSSASVFLTWEWLRSWWRAYGKEGELRILTATDGGVLRGIAPLRVKTTKRYGQTAETVMLLGDGSYDSDYLDFITPVGHEQHVFETFAPKLQEVLSRGSVLLLNEIPENSPTISLLKTMAGTAGSVVTETDVPCGTVALPSSWDEYLTILKPRFRTKARSVLRTLENRPEVRFGFCDNSEALERLLPLLFDLHTRRWHDDGKPGVFGWNLKRDFYRHVSAALLESESLRLSWLEWNGRVLACQFGMVHGGVYYHLQEGYEPESQHLSIGAGLRAWSIRELIRQGLREYDFLGGVGRHKTDWGATVKISKQLQLATPLYRNLLFCRGAEWETRAKETAANLLPKQVLDGVRSAMRRDHQNGNSPHFDTKGLRVRRAVANCYLHTGMPALIRGVRDRYRLAEGRFQKRDKPAARILYYHRVNDDGDPFFPSMPVRQFEEQMKYIARHYTVLSLTELLNRLNDGPAETMLAITFDDGYEDNRQFAAPILEKYGLPATIFLATGPIDSGEPLWFEQLAEGCKRTACEFIDLEIEFPQRFWFRTQAERLDSHARIYRALRSVPDAARRHHLPSILQQLDVTIERKAPMLTWDQIRDLKTRNFDFGGHTVSHPFLSKLTQEQFSWEVAGCKRRIEEETQHSVHHFAYPSGREEDFGEWNKPLLRQAGYQAAFTTVWGVNYPSTDCMAFKRGGPWEDSAAMFASKLDWYQLVDG